MCGAGTGALCVKSEFCDIFEDVLGAFVGELEIFVTALGDLTGDLEDNPAATFSSLLGTFGNEDSVDPA